MSAATLSFLKIAWPMLSLAPWTASLSMPPSLSASMPELMPASFLGIVCVLIKLRRKLRHMSGQKILSSAYWENVYPS